MERIELSQALHSSPAPAESGSRAVKYAMRTECAADSYLMRVLLTPWVIDWKETRAQYQLEDGTMVLIPDVDVEFVLVSEGPRLSEVRWLLNALVDCHVGAETVATAEDYTGERLYLRLESQMSRPSDDVIVLARTSLESGIFQPFEGSRVTEAVERLSAELGDETAYRERLDARYAEFFRAYPSQQAKNSRSSPRIGGNRRRPQKVAGNVSTRTRSSRR